MNPVHDDDDDHGDDADDHVDRDSVDEHDDGDDGDDDEEDADDPVDNDAVDEPDDGEDDAEEEEDADDHVDHDSVDDHDDGDDGDDGDDDDDADAHDDAYHEWRCIMCTGESGHQVHQRAQIKCTGEAVTANGERWHQQLCNCSRRAKTKCWTARLIALSSMVGEKLVGSRAQDARVARHAAVGMWYSILPIAALVAEPQPPLRSSSSRL